MYKLTLSKDERKAIDWVGYRYSNGDDLKELLCNGCFDYVSDHKTSNAWQEAEDITFYIPEHIAWDIKDNAMKEDGDLDYNFLCFSEDLKNKLVDFCYNVI